MEYRLLLDVHLRRHRSIRKLGLVLLNLAIVGVPIENTGGFQRRLLRPGGA